MPVSRPPRKSEHAESERLSDRDGTIVAPPADLLKNGSVELVAPFVYNIDKRRR